MTEITENQKYRKEELRKGRLKGYHDWLNTLADQVKAGKLAQEEMTKIIARAMYARDLMIERSRGKAIRDLLTGLFNRRFFEDAYKSAVDSRKPFGLLIIDIDSFKRVNDTYGHGVGDQVLVQLALSMSNNLRQEREESENDIVARWGGEEFAIILPGVDKKENLQKIAEKLRLLFSDNPLSVTTEKEAVKIPLTISLGGGIYRQKDPKLFFEKVDKDGLYQAKQRGRNQTVII